MKRFFLTAVLGWLIGIVTLSAQIKIDTNSLDSRNEDLQISNIKTLFNKYGQTVTFNDANNAQLRILTVKNGSTKLSGFSFRMGYYGYSFVLVPPGLEASALYETLHHKIELTAMGFTSFYADNYGSLKGTYTINYLVKNIFGERKMNANPYITNKAYNTSYNLIVNKKIRFKMGNYFGVERYMQHEYSSFNESYPETNIFGTTLHAGFSFSWLSDFRFMAYSENENTSMQSAGSHFVENDNIYKKSKENLFYFGYQHTFLDDYHGMANKVVDHGFVIGLLTKHFNHKYSASSAKGARKLGWFFGVESGIQAGPQREFNNESFVASRWGFCF